MFPGGVKSPALSNHWCSLWVSKEQDCILAVTSHPHGTNSYDTCLIIVIKIELQFQDKIFFVKKSKAIFVSQISLGKKT